MKYQILNSLGDHFRPEENSLIILNHRTRVDWNFMWSALLHGTYPPAHNAKLVLKDEIKRIPGLGTYLILMLNFSKNQSLKSHRTERVAVRVQKILYI